MGRPQPDRGPQGGQNGARLDEFVQVIAEPLGEVRAVPVEKVEDRGVGDALPRQLRVGVHGTEHPCCLVVTGAEHHLDDQRRQGVQQCRGVAEGL